ncbi:hypothetical protein EUTSA_v10019728mg [Eutrema salsugineum]|uniref:Factor of DNA methylation 1-5/IDN2 domain-containing protein n=1 Tax=Eutrema salsugineum TaxID=72664 RepID=V4KB28_EUTSA|nr:hypothetical protein EUTSA_v10019728mg [Eutrema salsugineum]
MNNSSDEESEISESEIDVYCDEYPYKLLKKGDYKVKLKEDTFRCPFCSGKKKQHYKYKDLLAHATGLAIGSASRSAKQKANHLALRKYMENELAGGDAHQVPRLQIITSSSSKQSSDIYVWPWMGIVINPLRRNDDKNLLLDSAYWLKKLARFNPLEVKTLWVEQDSVVAVISKFNSGMSGFKSATELEREYEINRCGKKDWSVKTGDWRFKEYGWCARADDYNSQGSIAEYLSTVGKLRSFSDISKEEMLNTNIVVDDLADKIAMTNEDLNKVQYKCNEKAVSLRKVLREKEELDQAYKEETKRMQEFSRLNVVRILEDKEKLRNKLKNLSDWSKELDKKEALTELERQRLDEDKKKSDALQKETDDRLVRLVEEHKRQKEETLKEILQLEKELASKQKLQMEIQELKGKLQVMRHVEDEDDEDVKEKMKKMNEELEEKSSTLEYLQDTNTALTIKDRQGIDEIQEARDELITGLREMLSDRTNIRIKRMGEIDGKPLMKACKERFTGEEAGVQHAMLCSKWQENLKNVPSWHPFKFVGTGDKMQILSHFMILHSGKLVVMVQEVDEQLRSLREEWGEDVKNAVKTALEERNECNSSGGASVQALWNFKEKKKSHTERSD